ncbi:MAG: hypothetical protein ABH950_00775 [Candidatus Altiarchaeota archaeon]
MSAKYRRLKPPEPTLTGTETHRPFQGLFESMYPHAQELMELFLSRKFEVDMSDTIVAGGSSALLPEKRSTRLIGYSVGEKEGGGQDITASASQLPSENTSVHRAQELFSSSGKMERGLVIHQVLSQFTGEKEKPDVGETLIAWLTGRKMKSATDYLAALHFLAPHLSHEHRRAVFRRTRDSFLGKKANDSDAIDISIALLAINSFMGKSDIKPNEADAFCRRLRDTITTPMKEPPFPEPPRGSHKNKSFVDIIKNDARYDKSIRRGSIPWWEKSQEREEVIRRGKTAIATFNSLSIVGRFIQDPMVRADHATFIANALMDTRGHPHPIGQVCLPVLERLVNTLPPEDREEINRILNPLPRPKTTKKRSKRK